MFYGSGGSEYTWIDIILYSWPFFIKYIVPFLIFFVLCLINSKLKKILISLKKDNEI